jgi:uncharacterized delta-60 repeat protein
MTSSNPQDWTFPFDTRFGVVRFTANGAIDKTFGNQGKAILDLGKGADQVSGIALQADGKVVVSGNTNSFAGGDNFFVARFTASGSVDSSFASKGYVVTDAGGSDWSGELAIQGDGRIVVVGSGSYGSLSTTPGFVIARYNTNGTLDTSFAGDGLLTTFFSDANGPVEAHATEVIVQASSLLVTGSNYLARYDLNGSLDPTFGVDGAVRSNMQGRALAIQGDGKIVLGGFEDFYQDLGDDSSAMSSQFALMRFSADGILDTTFGIDGKATTYLGDNSTRARTDLNTIAILPDGGILAAGTTGVFDSTGRVNFKLLLAKYTSDEPAAALAGSTSSAQATDEVLLYLMWDDLAATRKR